MRARSPRDRSQEWIRWKGFEDNAARLLGMQSEIGTIEEGKVADLVAVEENPISDAAAMREITFVMQSGRVVRDDRPAA